ncbi:hypothetical protein ACQEU3_33760 [Spirillospora sp. CA-253888]
MSTGHAGNVSFQRLIAGDLARKVAVVPQSLDNQWFDNELLDRTIREGRVTAGIEAEQRRRSRREYLRALLNAEKVIVNRAYLYNNVQVYQDYRRPGRDREAFRDLLAEGAIIPLLLGEDSPLPSQAPDYDVREGFEAWREVAESTPMACLRLSWDDRENAMLAEQAGKDFGEFLTTFYRFRAGALSGDFRLPEDEARALLEHLKAVGRWVFAELDAGRPVTRQRLYERYIVGEGGSVVDRQYDVTRPHLVPLKQIIDLKYTTNLADALDLFTLTPSDSPRRTALQESVLHQRRNRRGLGQDETDAGELIDLIRRLNFEDVQQLLEAVPTLDRLSLPDIRAVRRERAWQVYKVRLEELLAAASVEALADRDTGAAAVTGAYLEMLALAEEVHARNRREAGGRFRALPELAITIGATTVTVVFLGGDSLAYELVGTVGELAGARAARTTVRLGLGRFTASRAQRRIEHTAQLLDMRMDDPRREADKLLTYLERHGTRLDPGRNGSDQSSEGE